MRLIDADALIKQITGELCDFIACGNCQFFDRKKQMCEIEVFIDNAPTIDAVEVVRCKDCKHWHEWENGTGSCHRSENGYNWFGVDVIDFCSFGERREP